MPVTSSPDRSGAPGGYDTIVSDLQQNLRTARIPVRSEAAPRVLSVPAWVLTRVAGPGIRKLRADRLVELAGEDLRVGIYPSDIAISGTAAARSRARSAILSRLATTAAHLTSSAEAQALEDRIEALVARHANGVSGERAPAGRVRCDRPDAPRPACLDRRMGHPVPDPAPDRTGPPPGRRARHRVPLRCRRPAADRVGIWPATRSSKVSLSPSDPGWCRVASSAASSTRSALSRPRSSPHRSVGWSRRSNRRPPALRGVRDRRTSSCPG